MKISGLIYGLKHPLKHPLRSYYNCLLNEWEIRQKRIQLRSQPQDIGIEITTRCNLRCNMCDRTYWDKKHLNRDMSFSEFKNVVDQFPNTYSISLTGTGENLLNRNVFRMLKYLKDRKYRVGFIDNFTLLTKRISEKLMQIGIDFIGVSFDGGTKEVYEKIRVGAKFEQFMENLRNLILLKKELNSNIHVSSTTVIQRINENDLFNINKHLDELGIKDRTFSIVRVPNYIEQHIKQHKKIPLNPTTTNINIGYPINYAKPKKFMPMDCLFPFISTNITCDGLIIPCCVYFPRKERETLYNMGSLKEKSFREIWNNEKHQQMRKQLSTGVLPDICKNCPLFKR